LHCKCLYICFFKLDLWRNVPKFRAEQDIMKNFEESFLIPWNTGFFNIKVIMFSYTCILSLFFNSCPMIFEFSSEIVLYIVVHDTLLFGGTSSTDWLVHARILLRTWCVPAKSKDVLNYWWGFYIHHYWLFEYILLLQNFIGAHYMHLIYC
jgi:hypothetical protein